MHATGKPLTRQVDLNLLELFDTVYRLRNLTAAGQRLGLSQPAVSYGLARLRDMYGDALFVRMQRGVQPTPFAERLADPVAQALEIVRGTFAKVVFEPAEARRTFRIAMSDIGERLFLPYLTTWLAQRAPGVSVETDSPSLDELSEGLASGEIDAALGFMPGLGKQVHQKTLFTERFVYLLRAGHAFRGETLPTTLVRQLPHVIASPPGTEHASAVEKVLQQPRLKATVALRVRSFLSLAPIVAGTDLVAPMPSNLAGVVARHLGLRVCAPPVRFPAFDVCLYWHQRFHQDPASLWLREGLVGLFAGGQAFR
ncbi:LysR family transcriptional regulator [Micropruina sp.]|uniref:LysR family transcriptional regulator n=1 Tax=Micropruina sp. TaxID=2737536 RepID=UPI0039E31850